MDITEQDLFDGATSNEPMQESPVEATPEPETKPAIARDEAGRFAERQIEDEGQAGDPATAGTEPKEPPPHRFREVSERARAAEARAAELERLLIQATQARQPEAKAEPAPKPEFWENPDDWVGNQLNPVKTEVQQTREFFSRKLAEQAHGAEKVDTAYKALDEAIRSGQMDRNAVLAHLQRSMDPFGDIMKWHGEHSIRSEIGNDPEAYKQKIIAEYQASQQAGQSTTASRQAASGTVVKLPPNLNRMTSAASTAAGGDQESDQELFQATTSRRR